MEIRPGDRIPIPCRNCRGKLIPFEIRKGVQAILCPSCKSKTWVQVNRDMDRWIIMTSSDPIGDADLPPDRGNI